MPDETPVAVTLPAHAWKTVREAVRYYEHRLRKRSAIRPTPDGYNDLDGLRAETLALAAERIEEARP